MSMPIRDSLLNSILFRIAPLRVVFLFLFHLIVFTGAYVFAWLVRFEFNIPPDYMLLFRSTLPFVVGAQLVVGAPFGFYRGWWRYVGMADVIRLVLGLSTALVVLVAAWYTADFIEISQRFKAPRGVLLIDWAFALLTLFGTRVVIRIGRDRTRDEVSSPQRKVLIIGAGDAGEALAREIEHRPQLGMRVASFVDDQRAKWGSSIRGIQVKGPIEKVAAIANETGAEEALIAIPSASGKRVREIIRYLGDADLQFKTIPGIDHLVSGKVHVTQLRPVNVEDLLRRERIDLPGDPVRQLFRGKRVLVTGAGGTIGSELASQLLDFEPEHLTLVERSEFALYEVGRRLEKEKAWLKSIFSPRLIDVRDDTAIDALIAEKRPEIILHAAAHKHVPLGEENPAEYVKNNCLATRSLAEICERHDVERFVFISTDKAINPTSVMGASKRAAEIALLDLARTAKMRVTIVRFGNIIGSSGSAIPLFMEQIAAGGPVTVTHPEVTRYFLRTSEAISLVLQAATLGSGGHVFMLDMGEPIKIADLARDMIRLSNHTEDEIPIVFTGLRPGEKLFEEVRLNGESYRPTVHPQIVITEAPQPQSATVSSWLEILEHTTHETVRKNLQTLVPEFLNSFEREQANALGGEISITIH